MKLTNYWRKDCQFKFHKFWNCVLIWMTRYYLGKYKQNTLKYKNVKRLGQAKMWKNVHNVKWMNKCISPNRAIQLFVWMLCPYLVHGRRHWLRQMMFGIRHSLLCWPALPVIPVQFLQSADGGDPRQFCSLWPIVGKMSGCDVCKRVNGGAGWTDQIGCCDVVTPRM